MTELRLCSFEGCDKEHHARGYCIAHYSKLIRTGSAKGHGRAPKGAPHDFLNNVAVKASADECVIWPFSKRWHGRGQINIKGKICEVHRVVCEIVNGQPPSDIHEAAHSCGNGHLGCVSGNHLSWKTPKENAADKIIHGTNKIGQDSHKAKLHDDDIREIRRLHGLLSNRLTGQRFGVSSSLISMIRTGRIWGHVK